MSTGLLIFTLIHVALSLVAWVAGIVVVRALLRGEDARGWTTFFLVTAVATSATGFGFPFVKLLPSHIVGVVALAVLAVTILARYVFALAGPWHRIYAGGIVVGLFFDTFVLVAQAFSKIPPLHALAPTGSEPAFGVAQVAVLILFVYLTVVTLRRFGARPATG
jgi:hypothetical protein